VPPGRNTFNFPPIELIWTEQVKWVLKFIEGKTDEGTTATEIIKLLQTMFGYPDLKSFKDFFSLLMLRCKLSALLNPANNTFDFFIMEEGAGAEGGRVMLNIDSTHKSIGKKGNLESKVLIHVDFLSDPVPVPDTVTKVVRGGADVLWSLLPMGGASCQAVGVNPPVANADAHAAEIAKIGQRNEQLSASIVAQDRIIAVVMDAHNAAAAAGGGGAAAPAVDEAAAELVRHGVGSATNAIDIVLFPVVLQELAEQQEKVDAQAAEVVAGEEMVELAQQQQQQQQQQVAAQAVAESQQEQERKRAIARNKNTRDGGKSRKNTKRTRRHRKGRKSSKSAKKTKQRRSSRYRRSSRKGRK
jgi:hypothetical protein